MQEWSPGRTTTAITSFEVLVSTNLMDWTVFNNALSVTDGETLLQDSWMNARSAFTAYWNDEIYDLRVEMSGSASR